MLLQEEKDILSEIETIWVSSFLIGPDNSKRIIKDLSTGYMKFFFVPQEEGFDKPDNKTVKRKKVACLRCNRGK